ncbi:cyclase family protein [Bradyrhizobium sp.]|uniref:cyclase family protein n=1 Tax=Bradyrhizobium sp. TaxID=376 RepID=UPI00403803B6
MRRWIKRPPGSNWGDFGDDDQLGRLNLITAEKVRQGVAEVKEGRSFCLSLPLDYPGGRALAPHRFPPELRPTERNGRPFFNYSFMHEGACYCDVGSDDAVLLCTQYSTQWDSLAHIGQLFDADGDGEPELVYYNGFRAGADVIEPSARNAARPATALGIENMAAACVQGRGVMVDLFRSFGRDRHLVGYDDLMQILDVDHVTVESGDILCLHTGFADLVLEMGRNPDAATLHRSCAALDGTDERLLRWISDSDIAAIAADNYAVEALPSRGDGKRPFAPLHAHCLFKLGIHLGELWHLGPLNTWLRDHGRNRFLLTAPPLRLPGAVGSPVTPIGTA